MDEVQQNFSLGQRGTNMKTDLNIKESDKILSRLSEENIGKSMQRTEMDVRSDEFKIA